MTSDHPTDPSGLAPPSMVPVPAEVLDYLIGEVRALRLEIKQGLEGVTEKLRALRLEIKQGLEGITEKLADLSLQSLTRIEKLEEQAKKGFPVCHFKHENGHSVRP